MREREREKEYKRNITVFRIEIEPDDVEKLIYDEVYLHQLDDVLLVLDEFHDEIYHFH